MNFRIGFGVDVHQLVDGLPLIVGGVKIDSSKGALGHSDADVLIHAICDALLGAANLRDIGYHFSDTDPQFENIDSKILLRKSYKMIQDKGYKLGNIDCTVMLESPKLNPSIPKMQIVLSEVLETTQDNISIKATTSEGMGFVGLGSGIKAYCSALIYKS